MENEKLTKYKLERKISEAIYKDNGCTAHFIWEYKPNKVISTVIGFLELKVVTLNPTHSTHFLLHRVEKNLYNNVNIQDLYCAILQEVIDIFILSMSWGFMFACVMCLFFACLMCIFFACLMCLFFACLLCVSVAI